MSDASIETKEILVSVQANGIIRRADTGYLIARLSDGVAYDSLVVYDPKPCAELEADNRRLREALDSLVDYGGSVTGEDAREMQQIADTALASTEPEVCRCTDRQAEEDYCGACGKRLVVVNEEDSDGK